MRTMRKLLGGGALLGVALIAGVITAGAAFTWASGLETAGPEPESTVTVVVARDDISAGTKLTTALLTTREVVKGQALAGAIEDVSAVAGRTVRYPIAGGEQLNETKLVARQTPEGSGLAFSVPAGYRALSVSVDEVMGAGGLIVPGDRVDVMVATKFERTFGPGSPALSQNDAGRPVVMTVLQDALVLAVGQAIAEPLDAGRDPATVRPANAEAQPKARSVTLAVQPSQAQLLFMAAQEGKVGLALRPYAESTQQNLDTVTRVEPAGSGTIRQVSR